MKKLALLDGNNILYKAFFATFYSSYGNSMKTSTGIPTNAIYTFINMIEKILSENYESILVAFDCGKETPRHLEYPEYKAGREKTPDELLVQSDYAKKYLDYRGVKRYENKGYEADDIISIVLNREYNNFDRIDIYSDDKDLLQLMKKNVVIYGRNNIVTESNFQELYGLTPSQIIDYKAIAGDSSDNLPGVKGVGDKGAKELLNKYKTLDNIYANLEELSAKKQSLFSDGKETAYLCYRLATLETVGNFELTASDITLKEADLTKLKQLYVTLEMKTLAKTVQIAKETTVCDYDIVNDEATAKCLLVGKGVFFLESYGDNYLTAQTLGLGIYISGRYIYISQSFLRNSQSCKSYFSSLEYEKSSFDYKKTKIIFDSIGIDLQNVSFDLLLAAYVLDPAKANDDMAQIVSGLPSVQEIYGQGAKRMIPDESVYIPYVISKVQKIHEVEAEYRQELISEKLSDIYNIEMQLTTVLAKMEQKGVCVDAGSLASIGRDYEKQLNIISKTIYSYAGEEFNIASPKQLGAILFEKLHIPYPEKSKGNYSTAVNILEKLSLFPIVHEILDYREYSKLLSTYVNGILELLSIDNLIHPLYKQAYTSTGRLSSVNPNIQNMPIKTDKGQEFRKVFVSRFTDGQIMAGDYSQIELRILASLSGDETMIAAFNSHVDFHSKTASLMFGIAENEVTKEQRKAAKAINFGIIYGMKAWTLSENLKISVSDASQYINDYFQTYPQVKKYLDSIIASARVLGYSETYFGRRRYIDGLNDSNKNIKEAGERLALNAPIQGTAADVIKIAMIKICERMKENNLQSLLVAQVHDELVFDVYPGEKDCLAALVKTEMENVISLAVKLEVAIGCGLNWYEAK